MGWDESMRLLYLLTGATAALRLVPFPCLAHTVWALHRRKIQSKKRHYFRHERYEIISCVYVEFIAIQVLSRTVYQKRRFSYIHTRYAATYC
ncbi:hypothetical protein C8R45DRAFT_966004, partial [Mycena sanguinolenta]